MIGRRAAAGGSSTSKHIQWPLSLALFTPGICPWKDPPHLQSREEPIGKWSVLEAHLTPSSLISWRLRSGNTDPRPPLYPPLLPLRLCSSSLAISSFLPFTPTILIYLLLPARPSGRPPTQATSDKLLGGMMLFVASFVFVYYTVWALLTVSIVQPSLDLGTV